MNCKSPNLQIMKNYFFSVAIAIAVLPVANGQIKGLDAYKKVRNYDEVAANPGMKYHYKGASEAGLLYSCYVYTDPDELGNSVWILDGCEVSEEQTLEVYNELISILKANDLEVGDFDSEHTTEEFDLSDVTAAILSEGPIIHAVYRIGAGVIYFTAEPNELKILIRDRRCRRSLFKFIWLFDFTIHKCI